MGETEGLAIFLTIILIFSFIACAISALFNACFSIVFACITLIQFFRYHFILLIGISAFASVLFGIFLMGKLFDNKAFDITFVNLMLTIILFALGIPAFLGGLYIITLPLVPFMVSIR